MLLIIDYIFDWARNIYRPSIISQLETLATPAEETDDGVEIRLSRMLTDSDIFSLTGSQRKMEKDIDDWISSTLDLTESPQDEDLASNLKGSNLERDHEDSLIPSSSNPESATFNGSEQLVQNAFEIRSRKESTNEPNLERAHSASTKSLASGMGEDEAAELRAAITDSVFTRYQELVAQDPPTALPVPITTAIESRLSENGETDESESETARIDGTVSGRGEKAKTLRPYLVLEETASNNNLGAADPKTRTNNKESPLVLHNLPSASPWPSHVSSSPPPSLTDSTSSAPPTRADAPSPSPSIKPRTSSGPPKRPLESGDEFEVLRPRKKLKTSSGSAGIEVVIID
jgi:hypothetical protein